MTLENISERCYCDKHGYYDAEMLCINGLMIKSGCPVCDEEAQAESQKLKLQKDKEKQVEYFRNCNIEPEYYFKTLEDYKPQDEQQEKAKSAVSKMIENKNGKIVLLGTNGTGKTMLASIAAMQLGGKVLTMYEISTMIRQSYTVKAEKSELEIVKELASLPFLAIDELSRIKVSEAELNWRSFILDKRHTRNLPTMILDNGHFKSNCPEHGCSKCFENQLDNDILSRLRQGTTFVVMKSNDYRRSNH